MNFFKFIIMIASILPILIGTQAQAAVESLTRSNIITKGYLRCGVHTGLQGFSIPDSKGNWSGIDVDFCRAVAAAVLSDSNKVKFIPLTVKERFIALQKGQVDILSRNSTWTITRDTTMGIMFVGVVYYDGQGFIVKKNSGIRRLQDLNGSRICVQDGTTSLINLGDYFRGNGMRFSPLKYGSSDEAIAAYDSDKCSAFTTDQSQLYAQRSKLKDARDHTILAKVISKDPLGPAVRQGDDAWFSVVRWALYAMIIGEELGITSKNIKLIKKTSKDPRVHRFLGLYSNTTGTGLGLDGGWAYRIIEQVGNYGEVFERNLGQKSKLKVSRGLNELWSRGGIQYAPPAR
ncbi:MAG: amino acid ABC transporter substrate-binding protein [Magnetococcales bacterium]|nr:amino acid ABC transporter substrate-binding protein [Magnetococcales bacterium]